MTRIERLLGAFSNQGTSEFAVVASYETLYARDRWAELTRVPWWLRGSGIVGHELTWMQDFVRATGIEWMLQHPCLPREERRRLRYEEDGETVLRTDPWTGISARLTPPVPGGHPLGPGVSTTAAPHPVPDTENELEALLPELGPVDPAVFLAEGRADVARAARTELGVVTYAHVESPLSRLFGLFGYEGAMLMIAERPWLAAFAARRVLEDTVRSIPLLAALAVDVIWIEEVLTDQISPAAFAELNLPLMRELVDAIRHMRLPSVYYYCGPPHDRFDLILGVGADALHFEEGKKGFAIDIARVAEAVDGRCVLFGNLDAIGVLQDGTETELAAEVQRQVKAGRRNHNRFVMSVGSPITPGTPPDRVRLYTDLVRACNVA